MYLTPPSPVGTLLVRGRRVHALANGTDFPCAEFRCSRLSLFLRVVEMTFVPHRARSIRVLFLPYVSHLQVRDVSGMTTSARRLVHSMNRREVQQRFMMYSIGLVLVVGVIVAVYYSMKS